MTKKVIFLFLFIVFSFYLYGDYKINYKKAKENYSNIIWISIPYGEFKDIKDLALYFKRQGVKVNCFIKFLSEDNSTLRYCFKKRFSKYVGKNFKIFKGEGIGIVIKNKKINIKFKNFKTGKILLKGNKKRPMTYAISLPYNKYKTLKDIVLAIEKNLKTSEKIEKVGAWAPEKNKIVYYIYNKDRKVWMGNNYKLKKFYAVFITLKKGIKMFEWLP